MSALPEHDTSLQPRVLFVVAMAGLGGPVKRLATLLSNLHTVERVVIKPRSRDLDRRLHELSAIDEHIPVKRSAQRNWLASLIIAGAVFRRCLSRNRPIDVIHANGLVEFALCWPAAFLLRKPVVTWIGNYEPPVMVRRLSRIFQGVAKRTSWNAVSSFAAQVVEDCRLASRSDVRVVTNIVDPTDIRPSSPTNKGDPTRASVVSVGYLQVARWEKGFDLLCPVIEEMADLRGSVRFLVYASENSHPAWETLRNIDSGMLEIRPRTARVGDVYAECDIVFSPSRKESFNRVVAEAMMSGTPVVASDLAPVREVVGDAGLLFPVDDVRGASSHLRRLIQDEGLRSRLGQQGAHRSARWLPAPIADEFTNIYRRLTGSGAI